MLRKSVLQLFICILVLGSCAKTVPPALLEKQMLPDINTIFISGFEKVKDSVVVVKTTYKKSGKIMRERASGLVLASEKVAGGYDSYILTNWHVVEMAERIIILPFASRPYLAVVHGWDEQRDLALLKIKTLGPLVMVKFGNSEALRIGEWAFAVGSPYGDEWSLSSGIIGNLNLDPIHDQIQYDGSVNPGNSGGGLFNLRGELVGLTYMTIKETKRLGYAISTEAIRKVLPKLYKGGGVLHSFIGAEFSNVEILRKQEAQEAELTYSSLAEERAIIVDLESEAPGARAGLKKGDILLSINNVTVRNSIHGYKLVIAHSPDEKMIVKVLRGREELVLEVIPEAIQNKKVSILDTLPGVP